MGIHETKLRLRKESPQSEPLSTEFYILLVLKNVKGEVAKYFSNEIGSCQPHLFM